MNKKRYKMVVAQTAILPISCVLFGHTLYSKSSDLLRGIVKDNARQFVVGNRCEDLAPNGLAMNGNFRFEGYKEIHCVFEGRKTSFVVGTVFSPGRVPQEQTLTFLRQDLILNDNNFVPNKFIKEGDSTKIQYGFARKGVKSYPLKSVEAKCKDIGASGSRLSEANHNFTIQKTITCLHDGNPTVFVIATIDRSGEIPNKEIVAINRDDVILSNRSDID